MLGVVSSRRSEFSGIYSLMGTHLITGLIDARGLRVCTGFACFDDVVLDCARLCNVNRLLVAHGVACMPRVLHHELVSANHWILVVNLSTKRLGGIINGAVHVSVAMAGDSLCTLDMDTRSATLTIRNLELSVLNLSLSFHCCSILRVTYSFLLDDCSASCLARSDHWRSLLVP